jgi:protein-S-isoprenylcysteine O-methyltransferase Ste14
MQTTDRKQHDHDHRNLTGENKFGHIGQLTIAIVFSLVWLLDTFLFKSTVFLNDYIPNIIRTTIGIACLILSGYLAKSSHNIIFSEVRETPAVIRKGPYKIIRHPMYLSEILLYLGLLSFSISIAAAVVWIIAIGFFYYICRYEEQLLLQRFGEGYRKYLAEVPMWIPRIRKSKPQRR